MCLHDGLHVFGARVGEFYCLPIKQFMKFVFLGEVCVEKAQEFLTYLGGDSHVEWWIVPEDVSFLFLLSLFLVFLVFFRLLEFEGVLVPALVQGILVWFFRLVKFFFAA